MTTTLALATFAAVVLNIPSVLVLFRMVDGLDQVSGSARRLTVTIGTLTLFFLIASAVTSGYWLLENALGNSLIAAAIAFTIIGIAPFILIEETLYQSYVDSLDN